MPHLQEPSAVALNWIQLGAIFCYEFGTGTLGALAFVPPAPVGAPFYRVLAALAAIPIALGWWLLSSSGGGSAALTALTACVLGGSAFFATRTRGKARWGALGAAIAAGGATVILNLVSTLRAGVPLRAVGALSALGSGLLVGAIGVAMTLGHAYLTYPNLKISHLVRVNRVTGAVLAAKAILVILTIWIFSKDFAPLARALGSMGGMFGLFTRFAVGLALPLVFAWMVGSSLRYQNTRSATGILYASTVLVLIGEALAMSLRSQAGGVPL